MLTLSPGSICDVCAEEYNPHCVPNSIPCGHIFCWSCCNKIVQKTSPRLRAACPFCSEHFISGDVHLLHINFPGSGRVTPRWRGDLNEALHQSRGEDLSPLVEPSFLRIRAEARRLEDKVAKVVTRECSVEEVSTLYKELEEWLTNGEYSNVQSYSLSSSAVLLRTISTNHIAHSEATKTAKGIEAILKEKLDDMELKVSKLETDLKQYQALYTQKVQECQALRAELTRCTLKSAYSRAANLPARPSTAASTRSSERQQTVSSFAASTCKEPAIPPMLPRFASLRSRSASASAAGVQKLTTPACTMAPSIRSQTSTKASMLSSRLRATSPIPLSRPRTISVSPSRHSTTPPQIINRPSSDDQERPREMIYERWLPAPDLTYTLPTGKTTHHPKAAATLPQMTTPIQPDDDVWGLDDEWESDEDELELDEDGSELDEDGSELDEDGSESDEDRRRQEPIYERWIPSSDTMANPPTGKPVNYAPNFASFPPPGRARTSFSTNGATRLPQTVTPVQQDGDGWERGRFRERRMPPQNTSDERTGKTVNFSSYFGWSPAPSLARPSFSTYAASVSSQKITPIPPDRHERGRKEIHRRWMPPPNVPSNSSTTVQPTLST
ncbi:uncharacterized protein HD556DRAFT_1504599 [Suillus plorans]|uniref:RING-type domain-containing protein n=1 Tax=Suillus plorans TaxID=116603 RepID=A0A9P7AF29_9AGAM|nr:uncharacterized protein HD556DRAFT_1504599 [Suillus plorans]KAG1786953.1 hypothetical protein HD556DRAFT_1504599 [Suillus plorans]